MHAHHEWVAGHARAGHGLAEGRHGGLVQTIDWECRALGGIEGHECTTRWVCSL